MDEVGDIGPEDPVVVVEAQRRPEARLLGLQPDLADLLGRQLALAALVVEPGLELVEGDLAHHRVQHVLDLAGDEDAPALGVLLPGEQRAEGQHLAEDRGRLGQGQRRVGEQRALRARQHLMHAMAQLMGQGHHIAGAAVVVQQDIGMGARRDRMGEGAGRLARARRGIDPALVEEALADGGQLRREGGIGAEHDLLGLLPGNLAVGILRQAARCGPSNRDGPAPNQPALIL